MFFPVDTVYILYTTLVAGMFFQWILCISVWCTGLVVQQIRHNPPFYPLAMLGGFFWATGYTCLTYILASSLPASIFKCPDVKYFYFNLVFKIKPLFQSISYLHKRKWVFCIITLCFLHIWTGICRQLLCFTMSHCYQLGFSLYFLYQYSCTSTSLTVTVGPDLCLQATSVWCPLWGLSGWAWVSVYGGWPTSLVAGLQEGNTNMA